MSLWVKVFDSLVSDRVGYKMIRCDLNMISNTGDVLPIPHTTIHQTDERTLDITTKVLMSIPPMGQELTAIVESNRRIF